MKVERNLINYRSDTFKFTFELQLQICLSLCMLYTMSRVPLEGNRRRRKLLKQAWRQGMDINNRTITL